MVQNMRKKFQFYVKGLDCAEEINLLKKVLEKRDGVYDLNFDVLNAKMSVTLDSSLVSAQQVIEWVGSGGLEASLWEEREKLKDLTFWSKYGRLITTILSGLFLLAGFCVHYLIHPSVMDILSENHDLPAVSIRFYFFAIVFGAYFVIPKAFLSLKRLQPDMNLLMMVAICGAVAINQWFEGATVAFLFSVAILLEHWSMGRARRAVAALMDLSPTVARVIHPDGIKEVKVEEVAVGSHVMIRPGEKIPLDGVIVKGATSINQAPITGESIPVPKQKEDEVFAGTINEEGAIECVVTKKAADTTLARIIHLVQEAQSRRAPSQQWVEKFARCYTPIMMVLALLIVFIPPLFFGLNMISWFIGNANQSTHMFIITNGNNRMPFIFKF